VRGVRPRQRRVSRNNKNKCHKRQGKGTARYREVQATKIGHMMRPLPHVEAVVVEIERMISMKKSIVILLMGLLLSAALSGCGGKTAAGSAPSSRTPETAGSVYGKYLTAADVEEATGLAGLKATEEGLSLKFTDSNDVVVYEARFYGTDFYEDEVGANRKLYTDVPGVGEKAAICIPDSPYRLVFVKGNRCVMTQTLSKNADGEYLLSEEQLISIAKIIASKFLE